jgi:glucosamine-6-phosphate deaminase
MKIQILGTKEEMGEAAARKAEEILNAAITARGKAGFIAATGASQFEFLEVLTKASVDWSKTVMFHLDEYVGISDSHPASFRRYLKERLIDKVHPGAVHLIAGDSPGPEEECKRLNTILADQIIDVAFVGIGENGHLAFNDPPADFVTEKPYIVVQLDDACRKQQMGEGWFAKLEDVPSRAISMSIKQIMKSKTVICTVPDSRKARAVKDCLEGEVSPLRPASILREHSNSLIYLDKYSSALLKKIK